MTKVDLSEHEDILALFPGTYNLEITGMKHMVMPLKEPLPTPSGEPDVVVDLTGEEMNAIGVGSENGVDGRQGLFPVHVVKVSFEATYDVEDIKARQNKVLKAEGMAASIQGEGNLHDITPAEPKKVDFYLVNDGDEPISALIRSTSFVLFNAQNREAAAGTSGFYDTISEACDVLQPGERLLIKSYDFAVDKFPLNDKLITKKLGANEDKAIPGTYIAYVKATTADCTTADGQDVRGGNNVLIAAFEVRQ